MADVETWFKTMPILTKTYFVTAVATTVLVSFNMLAVQWLYLDFDFVFRNFQVWRLLTCFIFFGKFSLPFVFQIFILVRYMRMLEEGYFTGNRGTAEMTFMMLFGAVIMIVVAYLWPGLYFLGPAMCFMILYVWSRKDPYRQVVFWGFAFQAWQFPFVLLVVSILMGSSPLLDIVGIAVGHIYHFLTDVVPKVYNKQVLTCPQFMYNLFDQANVQARTTHWQRSQGHRVGGQ